MSRRVWTLLAAGLLLAVLAGCGGVGSGGSTTTTTCTVIVETVVAGTTTPLTVAADVVVGGIRGTVDLTQHWAILAGVPLPSGDAPTAPLTATAPGYVTVTQTVALNSYSYTTVSVEMTAADTSATSTVSGAVTDSATSAALSNALVTFTPDYGSAVTGYTDKAGHYHIGGIPAGTGTVMAQAAGYLEATQAVTLTPDASGSNAAINLALLGGNTKVTVTGTVVLVGLETPISGAHVTIGGVGPVTTSATGQFSLPGVPVGTQTVQVTATGYDDKTTTAEILPAMGPLKIYLSTTSPGPPPGPYTITGQVTSQTGVPISGVTVTALDLVTGGTADTQTTDSNGNYYLFVPPGRYEITATYSGHPLPWGVTLGGGGRIITGINFMFYVAPGASAAALRPAARTLNRRVMR